MKEITKIYISLILIGLSLVTSGFWFEPKESEHGYFKAAAKMATPRANHAATLLQDGRVLITGGASKRGYYKSAEIYDPKTNKFHRIADMNEPRNYHSSTLLNDGRVLIAGGSWGSHDIKKVEIFDPKTETFSYIGETNYIYDRPRTILLDDSKVLLLGNENFETFDPKTNTFKSAGNFDNNLGYKYLGWYDAVKLTNGKVAIFGGNATSSTERYKTTGLLKNFANKNVIIYNPNTQKTEKAGNIIVARGFRKAILLNNGKIFIVGGNNTDVQKKAEIYDFKTQKSKSLENANFFYVQHTVTFLSNGKVLLVGGYDPKLRNKAEIFDPETNKFHILNMKLGRNSHTATMLKDGRILITGGSSRGRYTNKSEIFEYEN